VTCGRNRDESSRQDAKNAKKTGLDIFPSAPQSRNVLLSWRACKSPKREEPCLALRRRGENRFSPCSSLRLRISARVGLGCARRPRWAVHVFHGYLAAAIPYIDASRCLYVTQKPKIMHEFSATGPDRSEGMADRG
jgi:hypothetical protein